MEPSYPDAWTERTPWGCLAAVHVPGPTAGPAPADPAEAAIARLDPAEAAIARGLPGRRRIEWVGGRLAFRRALAELGVAPAPLLAEGGGAPIPPPGIAVSISHKETLAAALVARDEGATLGLDLERRLPARPAIAARVLTDAERRSVDALPEGARWEAVLARFAVKEALYKALYPRVRRYVRFEEAEVEVDGPTGGAEPGRGRTPRVLLRLSGGEGPYDVEAEVALRDEWLIAMTRIRSRGTTR